MTTQPSRPDETEKTTGHDGHPVPPGLRKPRSRAVTPESDKGSGGSPPEETGDAGKPPSPSTADDVLQRRGEELEGIEGLTDNKAGG